MNKINILVTGGPVHAYLDAVKLITNRFKGGRMAEFADTLNSIGRGNINITYLTSKGSNIPKDIGTTVIYHNGFDEYMQKVLELAPNHDGVILGAAVCNLIPMNPFKGKFPSHNYRVGDRIPIDFTIAPRVIDEVKRVAPNTKLIGFKLLQGVEHQELIDAAYGIVLESRAVGVIANDANDLNTKFFVTKEKGIIEFDVKNGQEDLAFFVVKLIKDEYYSTTIYTNYLSESVATALKRAEDKLINLLTKYEPLLDKQYGKEKYKFGTIAVRVGNTNSFVTTARGKKRLNELSFVQDVDHNSKQVFSSSKATLNAPLLHKLLEKFKDIQAIVHYHSTTSVDRCFNYLVPGTARDVLIANVMKPNCNKFYIDGHGTFELLTANDC